MDWTKDVVEGILVLGLIVFIVIPKIIRKYQSSKINIDSSLLVAMYSSGVTLAPVSTGKLAGMPYSIMMTEPKLLTEDASTGIAPSLFKNQDSELADVIIKGIQLKAEDAKAGVCVLVLTLPSPSVAHVAGLGIGGMGRAQAVMSRAKQCNLMPQDLEGDFPDYFKVFCDPDHQIEMRQVLDPDSMEFLVDYCQRENWELIGNSVYFAQNESSQQHEGDNGLKSTTIVEDAQQFVTKILPVLQQIDKAENAPVAYGTGGSV